MFSMGSLKYIGCPIGLDNREKSHFLPCAAQEVFVLVGAEVAAVTVALHQLEYVVLARHCIDRLLNQVEYTGCFFMYLLQKRAIEALLKLSTYIFFQVVVHLSEIYMIYHPFSLILYCSTEKINFKTCAILQCAFDAIIEKCV